MELLNQVSAFLMKYPVFSLCVMPLLFCGLADFVFRKRDEFSFHAMQNTAATITLVGCNLAVLRLFGEDVDTAMQSAYSALNIPTLPSDIWSTAPLALVCILGLVAKDFADYWTHRLMHTTWLWPTHAAHRSDTHVNAFTVFRVHFLETLVMGAGYILILTWMQMPQAIPIVYFLAHLHGLYVHTNLPFRHGPFKLLIASPPFIAGTTPTSRQSMARTSRT